MAHMLIRYVLIYHVPEVNILSCAREVGSQHYRREVYSITKATNIGKAYALNTEMRWAIVYKYTVKLLR